MANNVIDKTVAQFKAKLDQIRDQIRECDDEISWLHNAPQPLDEALLNIDRFLAEKQQELDISPFFSSYNQGVVSHPLTAIGKKVGDAPVFVEVGQVVNLPGVIVDESALWCTLQPEAVKAVFYEQAKRFAELVEAGPPLAERAQLIEATKQRRYALEVEEEALISEAEESGIEILFRRGDANEEIGFMKEVAHA